MLISENSCLLNSFTSAILVYIHDVISVMCVGNGVVVYMCLCVRVCASSFFFFSFFFALWCSIYVSDYSCTCMHIVHMLYTTLPVT